MSSVDSDTVLLNNPDESSDASEPQIPRLTRQPTLRKCWICLNDASEDDQTNPPKWRSPCSCNLTAHEACLLDWVADLENPKSKRRTSGAILCPQCKTEIKVERPKSYVVAATQIIDRQVGKVVLPGIVATLFGTAFAGAWIHGFQSVYLVFGRRDASHIFSTALSHRGWVTTYALVPINLIFAQTKWADYVLPSGTLFLLSTQLTDPFYIDWTLYPPLPSTVFACLPAISRFYNWSYNKAFGELNKKWQAEIAPRQDENAQDLERNAADVANEEAAMNDAGIVFEVELNMGGGQGEGEGDQEQQGDGPVEGGQEGVEDGIDGNAHVHQVLGGNRDFGGPFVGSTLLGALVFPGVAAGMGELISYVIPKAWMASTSWVNGRPGFLRNKWGRSVVGGCLFVVLKDALVLYCRWKLAQTHRFRRIMDYDKKTKKYYVV